MTPEPVHERRKRTFKVALPKMLVGMALYLASGWRAFTSMKPVRGIETFYRVLHPHKNIVFHINETRSRD